MLHANTSEVATVAIVRSTKTNALMGLCLFSGEDLIVCNSRFQASTRTASNTLNFMIIYCHGVPLQKCLCNRLGDQTTLVTQTQHALTYIWYMNIVTNRIIVLHLGIHPSIHPSIHSVAWSLLFFCWVWDITDQNGRGAKPGLARRF